MPASIRSVEAERAALRPAREPRRRGARRRRIVEMTGAGTNRRKQARHAKIKRAIDRHLARLQGERAGTDQNIDQMIRKSKAWMPRPVC
ncbi:MAG: hypothetical protein ACREDA_02490 [Methylocella sp.]